MFSLKEKSTWQIDQFEIWYKTMQFWYNWQGMLSKLLHFTDETKKLESKVKELEEGNEFLPEGRAEEPARLRISSASNGCRHGAAEARGL